MQNYIGRVILMVICVAAVSCKKDNYAAPGSTLNGRIVYKGESIGVEYDKVPFQVFQYGFGKTGPINGTFAPDGTFSLLLFNGEYKFTIPNDQGPFRWKQTAQGQPDTVTINLNGSQTADMEVLPYYMIRTPQLTVASGKLSATFAIEKIITDGTAKNIEQVTLYLNKTVIVSGTDNLGSASINGGDITDPLHVNLQVDIPTIVPTQQYVFARIGLKIAGVEDRIFSPLVKLNL